MTQYADLIPAAFAATGLPERTVAPLPISARSTLPLYPDGWFRVASSEELTANRITPLNYFGTHYIGFRAADGSARVADAYCPHLGAHLASHTGKLENGVITCPFHRWQFETGGGRCVKINYADKIPSRAALALHPVREVNGMVLMWRHGAGKPPAYEPYVETKMDEGRWIKVDAIRWEMQAQQQEFMENIFDPAHILELHGGDALPKTRSVQETPYGLEVLLDIDVPDPDFPVAQCLNRYTGISLACQNNVARGENIIFNCFTPIDAERVEQVATFWIRDLGPDLNNIFGAQFVERFKYEVYQDLAILAHKKHLERPLLCGGDGPIMAWRRYARRFYSGEPASSLR